jgi:hypothetical protein
MLLTDLEAYFVRYETCVEPRNFVVGDQATWHERGCPVEERIGPVECVARVDTLAEAQGVWFLCPKCYAVGIAGGEEPGVGVHGCQVTFEGRGATDQQGSHNDKGEPVRWAVSGTGIADLVCTPSILLIGGCGWHGFIGSSGVPPGEAV